MARARKSKPDEPEHEFTLAVEPGPRARPRAPIEGDELSDVFLDCLTEAGLGDATASVRRGVVRLRLRRSGAPPAELAAAAIAQVQALGYSARLDDSD